MAARPAIDPAAEGRVCVGAVAGAHGLAGLIRVKSFTAKPAAIDTYGPLDTEAGDRTFRLSVIGLGGQGQVVARIDGVADRAAAEKLKGTRLYVSRDRLPALTDTNEFYHTDLIGLAAYAVDGARLGSVRAVHDFGAGDLLQIVGEAVDVMVPFTQTAVPTVDLAQRRVVVDLPAGLRP